MKRVIAIGLSPNTKLDDVIEAIKQLFMPWAYQNGSAVSRLEQWFCEYFNTTYAISFSNARSALYVILKCLDIGKNDEVILQAFTCVVVPNAVLALGAKPIYADINQKLTLDLVDLEKKITKKTKAIIIQHTFGIPADMDGIIKLAEKHKLYLIEDAAHTIGAEYKGKKIGTLGDAAIFSLGRDKAFSSVFGGMAVTSNKKLGEEMKKFQRQKPYPSFPWIAQQLFHPIASSLILPLYNLGFGKLILILLQKLHLLSFPLEKNEKKGHFNPETIHRYPNALAVLALRQVKKINIYNQRRIEIANKYKNICEKLGWDILLKEKNILLRFPLFVDSPEKMRKYFREKGKIFLGNWYSNIIDPKGSDLDVVGYKSGSCPKAESFAKKIINLPTYPAMSDDDVEKVCSLLKDYAAN